jgi:hypothetical protein
MRDESTGEERLSSRTAALVDLARASLGPMTEGQRVAGLQALRERLSRRQAARRWGGSALAACGVGACALVATMLFPRHRALSIRVEGGAMEAGGGVAAASPSAAPVLHFSDGSEIALRSGAHVRLRSIDDRGARVTLDDGEAHVYVVHAPETRWAFEAGPFVVAVTGTAFGLSWRESTSQLDVRLENGSVTVTGPPADAPLALRSGQWLTVRGSEVRIRELGAEPAPGPSAEEPPTSRPSDEPARASAAADPRTAAADIPRERTEPGDPGARRGAPERGERHDERRAQGRVEGRDGRWRSELASGQFQAIVDQALGLGLDVAYARSSADELAALADAARYTRHDEIALGALQALRHRFAGTGQAKAAAFFLGRMAEAEGDARASLEWLDAYLAEAPNGTYAPEALGRKMTLVERLEGRAATRSLAEAYLRRFPAGAYAHAAQALLSDAP